MGYIRHHAMIITSWNKEHLARAHEWIAGYIKREQGVMESLSYMLSPMTDRGMNSYRSFALFPDGGKEGVDTSDRGDAIRAAIKYFFRNNADNLYLSWVEVEFGGYDDGAIVLAHNENVDEDEESEGR